MIWIDEYTIPDRLVLPRFSFGITAFYWGLSYLSASKITKTIYEIKYLSCIKISST